MSCDIGLHRIIKQVLNDRPWFKYKQGDTHIRIVGSPKLKINKDSSIGVAKYTADQINKIVNNGDKNIGKVCFPEFDERGWGRIFINPTTKQLDLLNASDRKEVDRLQKEVDLEERIDELKAGNNYEINSNGDITTSDDNTEDINDIFAEVSSEEIEEFKKRCK